MDATISRQERDVLRDEAIFWDGDAEEIAKAVRGERPAPEPVERAGVEEICKVLDILGWEKEGEQDAYELPASCEGFVKDVLRGAREGGRPATEIVCGGVLERFTGTSKEGT
jgi:hypothetical protein